MSRPSSRKLPRPSPPSETNPSKTWRPRPPRTRTVCSVSAKDARRPSLGIVQDGSGPLVPELVVGSGQPTARTVEDVHRARIHDASDILFRHADRQVGEAVAVEITGRHGAPEVVSLLGTVLESGRVLTPDLAVRIREAGDAPV